LPGLGGLPRRYQMPFYLQELIMPSKEYSYSEGDRMVCMYYYAEGGRVEVSLHDKGIIERVAIRDMDESYFDDLRELKFDALKCAMGA
jgi:hypothetical protein